jgi:hypothetical protein
VLQDKFSLEEDNELSLVESLFEFSDVVLFLHRNLLDSYISLRKADELNFWVHKDTTHYKIMFNPTISKNIYSINLDGFKIPRI